MYAEAPRGSDTPPVLVSSLNPEEDTIRVTDFSISRDQTAPPSATTLTVSGTSSLGTPHWCGLLCGSFFSLICKRRKSPEVIKGENFTAKSDVHSYGIVLWQIYSRQATSSFSRWFTAGREMPFTEYKYGHQIEQAIADGASPCCISQLNAFPGKRPKFAPPKDAGSRDVDLAKELAKLGEYCWERVPDKRPSFDDIVTVLSNSLQVLFSLPPALLLTHRRNTCGTLRLIPTAKPHGRSRCRPCFALPGRISCGQALRQRHLRHARKTALAAPRGWTN